MAASSSLAAQLRAIALSQPGAALRKDLRGRPSLIFDPQEAANVDLQTIYSIALSGFSELCDLDGRFAPFGKTLFSRSGADLDREQQDAAANKKLDASITAFLPLLCNYLLLPAAHQALELLIRRYKIQQYNVEAVLACCLPYHETNLFVKLVQLLDLDKTPKWRFMTTRVQQSGASLPRELLVQQSIRDPGVLSFICEAASDVSASTLACRPMLSFFAVMVMEVLAAVPAVTDDLVGRILPSVLSAFRKDRADEYQAGALMITAQLANRATLATSLLDSLLLAISRHTLSPLYTESLMVMVQLFQTQHPKAFPLNVLQALLKRFNLIDSIAELATKFDLSAFLAPLLDALVERVAEGDEFLTRLKDVLEKVDVNEYVGGVATRLLGLLEGGADDQTKDRVKDVLRLLDKRYSIELDKAVNSLMGEADKKSTEFRIFDILQETFQGGLHAPLAESHASLFLSVDHPEPTIRKVAIERLAESAGDEEVKSFLEGALLRRLRDEDLEVLAATVALPGLVDLVSREALFEALEDALAHASEVLEGTKEGNQKAALSLGKGSLKLLAGGFLERHPGYLDRVGCLILGYVLVLPKTKKLNRTAIAQASKLTSFFLFSDLKEVAELAKEKGTDGNTPLVKKLTSALAQADQEPLEILVQSTGGNPRSRAAFLLGLLMAADVIDESAVSGFLNLALSLLKASNAWAEQGDVLTVGKSLPQRISALEQSMTAASSAFLLQLIHKLVSKLKGNIDSLETLYQALCQGPSIDQVTKLQKLVVAKTGSKQSQLAFLARRFATEPEESSTAEQVRSLEILRGWITSETADSAVVPVLTALASPLKKVRRVAVKALEAALKVLDVSREEGAEQEGLVVFLNSLVAAKSALLSEGGALGDVIQKLIEAPEDVEMTETGFPDSTRSEALDFLVSKTITFEYGHYGQYVLLTALLPGISRASPETQQQAVAQLQALLEPVAGIKDNESWAAKVAETSVKFYTPQALGGEEGGPTIGPLLGALGAPAERIAESAGGVISREFYEKLDEESQEQILEALLTRLGKESSESIRTFFRTALSHISITVASLHHLLSSLITSNDSQPKRKKKQNPPSTSGVVPPDRLPLATALLEMLQWKGGLGDRSRLIGPLSTLQQTLLESETDTETRSISATAYLQQLVLGSLESIAKEGAAADVSVELAVQSVRSAGDAGTRNQALSLLAALAKLRPQEVVEHVLEVATIIGSSSLSQEDSASHRAVAAMLAAVVPPWVAVSKNIAPLLKVFVEALPRVPPHRRLGVLQAILHAVPNNEALPPLLLLLLQLQTDPPTNTPPSSSDWVVTLADLLCRPLAASARLRAYTRLLELASSQGGNLASEFVGRQLGGRDFAGGEGVQGGLVALMEQVLVHLQGSQSPPKSKGGSDSWYTLLDALYSLMEPAAYLKGISSLIHHRDRHVRRKVLKLLTTELRTSSPLEVPSDSEATEYRNLISQIAALLHGPSEDTSAGTKQAAFNALGQLARRLGPFTPEPFVEVLPPVTANISSDNKVVSSAAITCAADISTALGPRALPHLGGVVTGTLGVAKRAQTDEESLEVALSALEKLISDLGAFLSPYLIDILSLVILKTPNDSESILKLLPEKVPGRLLLDPIFRTYEAALETGGKSIASLFDLLGSVASRLDRPGVNAYHGPIFDFLLKAFDVRRTSPADISTEVEASVIGAFVSLVLKLSENTFKPLFLKALEWSQTDIEGNGNRFGNPDRNIFFFGLVNAVSDKLRSVFVPYFRYLLEGCVAHLGASDSAGDAGGGRPKKKKKRSAAESVSAQDWHLRTLVLSALHKCFLYDTVGFLDPPRFQQLLPPLVAQLRLKPPPGELTPPVKEAGEVLVSCLGQMAITGGSDALWRPLNREVLMATRSSEDEESSSRPKVLALAVVMMLVERVREEYLVLLPETIPFLAELLEDADLEVVAKTQALVKLLEELSGESLQEYF